MRPLARRLPGVDRRLQRGPARRLDVRWARRGPDVHGAARVSRGAVGPGPGDQSGERAGDERAGPGGIRPADLPVGVDAVAHGGRARRRADPSPARRPRDPVRRRTRHESDALHLPDDPHYRGDPLRDERRPAVARPHRQAHPRLRHRPRPVLRDPRPHRRALGLAVWDREREPLGAIRDREPARSEEHTSELQSRLHLVCRLLLENKNTALYDPRRVRNTIARAFAFAATAFGLGWLVLIPDSLVFEGEDACSLSAFSYGTSTSCAA